jgi:hypothetical protein
MSAVTRGAVELCQAVLLAGLVLAGASPLRAEVSPAARGWALYEVVGGEYQASTDRSVAREGRASGRLASRVPSPTRHGLLGQVVDAGDYAGKRVRFSAFVRTEKVVRWCGLFMRIDGQDRDPKRALVTDGMERRPIRGTSGWTPIEVVLDVPAEASQIAFGASLTGAGSVWIDQVRLEVVDRSVPTTDVRPPRKPQNTGFEE